MKFLKSIAIVILLSLSVLANTVHSGMGYHVLTVKTDGTLWAWGDNSKGQLGVGTNSDSNTEGIWTNAQCCDEAKNAR